MSVELRDLAIDIAREAGELAARRRAEGVRIAATKSTLADIVTEADREVERLIRDRLASERPADGIIGEEYDPVPADGLTWIVDPIDGTVNYAQGIPFWAVSIAVVSGPARVGEWTAQAGAIYAPATGEMFSAARGAGARLDAGDGTSVTLRVAEPSAAGELVATGFGYDVSTHAGDLAEIARLLPFARDLRRFGAASLDLASVAAGRIDAYSERDLKAWDHAAGALLVTEAGGTVSFLEAKGARPRIVAGSRPAHDRVVAALTE
ncbi:inositol monophosphatase family protein [Microbacterium gorillae]|uniref:inositol monophosphatase family protein n=1 Tax=Microbacterium gorillae TaxID=1231063 RepID=UPI003D97D072